jgi:pimeloyl-ACP methyl ester carboxylesterase
MPALLSSRWPGSLPGAGESSSVIGLRTSAGSTLPGVRPSVFGLRTSFGSRLSGFGFVALFLLAALLSGCTTPIGATRTSTDRAYRQTYDNAVSHNRPSRETQAILFRFDQLDKFDDAPDETLRLLHAKAVQSGDRDLLFALSELNYLTGERLRQSLRTWDPRDARDYYLASAVYAWLFLLGDPTSSEPTAFDQRFRTACDLYNYSLGWALTARRSTNAVAILTGGTRRLSIGQIDIDFTQPAFPWPLSDFKEFLLAGQFNVRGLAVRNGQPGLGAPLIAVTKPALEISLSRSFPATVLLRVNGGLKELSDGTCRGSLELYGAYDATSVQVGTNSIPLETDTTTPIAYSLNQSTIWRLGMLQFLSAQERIPTGIYPLQPPQPGRIPVVFVHGTFSSPVWWVQMVNTLMADAELRERCQFWYFIYNSGNPVAYSAVKLREALTAEVKQLDPNGQDPALQQMVVIGHSQGGLLTKLTVTDTGDRLLNVLLKTNRLDNLKLTERQQQFMREYAVYQPLPFVKRVVFISTPHRGSYLANSLARRLARAFLTLPSTLLDHAGTFTGLAEKLDFPKELRGVPTSLDGMSPRNPFLAELASIPVAPGVKSHSIIPVKGNGDYHEGKDGVVAYQSAYLENVESELVVRGPHSCQGMPPTIEEVRRILHEHLDSLSPAATNHPSAH